MELQLSSCGSTISSKVTKALHWWQERDVKHQPATSTVTMVENLETEVFGMITLMNPDSLACAVEYWVWMFQNKRKVTTSFF